MARFNHEIEDLNEEVDYDFFDDKNSEISNTNNNAVTKLSNNDKKEVSVKDAAKASQDRSKLDSVNQSDSKLKYEDDDTFIDSSPHSSSSSSSPSSSKALSKSSSEKSSKVESHRSKHGNTSTRSLSSGKAKNAGREDSSLKRSSDDSDVTSISSLESDNISVLIEATQKPIMSGSSVGRGHRGGRDGMRDSGDADMISASVILQAMMRIHDQGRLAQQLRPRWVDPNTKDYSVAAITSKMNLLPDRIVSMQHQQSRPTRNMRSNPFVSDNNRPIDRRLYHTAINRSKEHDRIERENKTLVARLQRIRPSPGITKEELLKAYSKVNRFPGQSLTKSRVPSTASSCRPLSSTNSTGEVKIRRTNSSTIISRFVDSQRSNSRHSESKRTSSPMSLPPHGVRQISSHSNSTKKRN